MTSSHSLEPPSLNTSASHSTNGTVRPFRLEPVPRHVGLIMDGNGRWGQLHCGARTDGHQRGVEALRQVVHASVQWGIADLTVFAFSTENWCRPASEVAFLMRLVTSALAAELPAIHDSGIRLRFIGELEALPPPMQDCLAEAERSTCQHTNLNLNVALNYGGRREIAAVARAIAHDVEAGQLCADDVDESLFAAYLRHTHKAAHNDPELIIRTGGEQRLSNFMLWHAAYSELYVTDVLWPDFTAADFAEALREYARRQRRFGGVRARPS